MVLTGLNNTKANWKSSECWGVGLLAVDCEWRSWAIGRSLCLEGSIVAEFLVKFGELRLGGYFEVNFARAASEA